jgi:peptidyl-dipeptidase Dcp
MDNPFFLPSTLPYQLPDFARITESDYEPAFEEGMREHLI